MFVYNTIKQFLNNNHYLQDPHVIGVLFYGSYKYGLNNRNSDLDLHIIYDDSKQDRLVRGNAIVNGIRVEYFEKPISEVVKTIDEGYLNQDNAAEAIIGRSEIIFQRDNRMHALQRYAINKFKNGVLPLSKDEACEQVAIINGRMERLQKYAKEDSYYFEHLYHLTIEKIRRFYHNLNGMPRIETSKGFNLYRDKKYQDMFSISKIPDEKFLEMYFRLITSQGKSKRDMFADLEEFYNYAKRTVDFNDREYRIPITWRYLYPNIPINKNANLDGIEKEHIPIPADTLRTVLMFIKDRDYIHNEHYLGTIVYGSSLTGHADELSDVDLHVIMDSSANGHIIRGKQYSNGKKVEYFEKSIDEEYLMAENEFYTQNNASYAIIGRGEMVLARDSSVEHLQKYVINRFKDKMPPLSENDAKEQISIIDNKVQKLDTMCDQGSPYFNHYYHLVLEKMRKVHHKIIGISQIATSKVPRIYTDEAYRKAACKTNPSQDFVDSYLTLVRGGTSKPQMLSNLKAFYEKTKHHIHLGKEYRIPVKSHLHSESKYTAPINLAQVSNREQDERE